MDIDDSSGLNITTGPAISLGDISTVNNRGLIKGGSAGVLLRNGRGTLTNSGVITADAGTAVQFSGAGENQFINNGTVIGSSDYAVQFAAGPDTFLMNGGYIDGSVSQGENADKAIFNEGVITGAVEQGEGTDEFIMHSGSLGSLAQGDNRDSFIMTGGVIAGAFTDGDVAHMNGGTIGRVDMKLDNNFFDMSGGKIIGNLVTGFGNDTIIISNGIIGGNISVSSGTDSVTVRGGNVEGEIRLGNGQDTFLWENRGLIKGGILMGAGDDNATLRNFDTVALSFPPSLDAGTGTDTLTLDDAKLNFPSRLTNWEMLQLVNGSALTLNSALVLGDETSGTGTLIIDATSTLYGGGLGETTITPINAGRSAAVNNSGTIDLTNNGSSTADSMIIMGNYTGSGGILKLQTVLGGDSSPSDRLIISGGEASGSTQIQLTTLTSQGAYTSVNGIELVSTINSGTTTLNAFSLQNGAISAGAYEYVLFRGGVTPGNENNWYLRNQLIAPSLTSELPEKPEQPEYPGEPEPVPVPQPAPGSPILPAMQPGEAAIPLYRPETPLYSAVVPVVLSMGIQTVSTFHERQGAQLLLTQNNNYPALWSRTWGIHHEQNWSGETHPSFEGNIRGIQIGQDVWSNKTDSGQRDHLGLFYSFSRARGDVDGLIMGFNARRAGKITMNGNSLGGYWTHLLKNNAYLDMVGIYTWLDGSVRSVRGLGGNSKGRVFTGSLETGYPFKVSKKWSLEPQIQFIGQHISIDAINDNISAIRWQDGNRYTGRLGTRLSGDYDGIEPYLKANLWHDFLQTDNVRIGNDHINTRYKSTRLELGAGFTAQLSRSTNLYMALSRTENLDRQHQESYSGNVGIRVAW